MKSLKNLFVLLLAALALTFTFTACSDDDDDPEAVAVFKTDEYDDDDAKAVDTITFYDDGTFVWHYDAKAESANFTVIWDMTAAEGTYTGNPANNGEKITATPTSFANTDKTTSAAAMAKVTAAAASGSSSITLTNADFPLDSVPADEQEDETLEVTIASDGTFELDEQTFKRQ